MSKKKACKPPAMFTISLEMTIRNITDWKHTSETFEPVEHHVTIRRNDGRERHIHGEKATLFMELIGGREAFQLFPTEERSKP